MAKRNASQDESAAVRSEREADESKGEFVSHPQEVPARRKPVGGAERAAASSKADKAEAGYERVDQESFSADDFRAYAEKYQKAAEADLPHELDPVKFALAKVAEALRDAAQIRDNLDLVQRGPEPVVTNWNADRYEPKAK